MESSFHLRRIGRRPAAPDSTDYIHFVKPTTLMGRNRDVVDYFLSCHGQQGKDYISRTHARVIRSNAGSFRLVDSSLTGVYVNDMRIEGGHVLCEGDTVTFGHPTRTDICPGTKIRQPNSLFYFLFERCHCAAGGSPADGTAHTQRSEIPAVASVVSLNMKQESMRNPAVSDMVPPFVQSTHSPEIGVAFSQSVTSIEDTWMSAGIIPSHSPEYDLTQSVPSSMDPQGLFDKSSEEDISEDCSSDMTLDEDSSQSLSNLSPMKGKWDDILSDSSSDIEESPDPDSTSSSDVSSDMEIIPHQDHMVESEDLDYKDLQPNFHKPYTGSAQCPKKLAADGICNKKTHAVQLERMKSDQRGQLTAPQTTFEGLLSQVGDSKQNRDASSDKISDEKYLFQLSALAQTGVDRETPNFNHHNPNHNVISQQKNMSLSEEIRMDTSQVSRSKRDIKQIKKMEDVSNSKVDIQESSSAVIGCHDGGEGQAPKYTAVSDEEMVEAYLLSSGQDPEAMLQTSATLEEIVSGDLDKKSDPECDNTESGDGNLDTSEVNEESHTSFNSMAESEVLNKCSPEDSSSQTEEAYVQNESDMVDEPTTNNLTLNRYKKEHVIICEPGNPMTEEEGIPWVVMETSPHGAPCETSYINDAISCDGDKRCRKCKMSGPGDERASGFHNTDDLQQHEDEQNLIHKQSEDVRDGKSCCEMISTVRVTEDDIDVPMTYVASDRPCLRNEEQLRSQQSDGKPSGAFGADSKDKSCSLELSERIYQEKTNSPGFAKETAMCVEVTHIMSEDPETKQSEQTTAFIRPNTPSFGLEQPTRASQNGVNYTEKSTPYDPSSPINRDISSFSLKRGLNEISRSFAPEVPRTKIRRIQEESVDPNCSPRTVGCYEGKLVSGIVHQFFTNYLQPEWVGTTKAAGSPEKKNIIAQMVMDFFQSLKNETGIDTNPPPNTDDLPYEKRESDHRLSFTRVVGHNDEDDASVFSNDSMEQTVCVTHAIPDTAEEAQTVCVTHAMPDTAEESDNVCVTHAIPDTAEEAQTVCVTHAIPDTAEEAQTVCVTHAIPDTAEESDNVCVTHAIPDTADEAQTVCVTHAFPDTAEEAQTVCVTHPIPDTAEEAQTVCVTHAIPDTAEESDNVCVTHAIPDTAEESDNVCVTHAIPDTADEAQTVCVTHAIPDTADEAQTVCATHAIPETAEESDNVCVTHAIPDTAEKAWSVCGTRAIPDTAEESDNVCVTHAIPDTADEAQTVCVTHAIPDMAEESDNVCVTHSIPDTAEEAQTVCVTHAIPDTAEEAWSVCGTHAIPDTAEESDNVCVTHAIPETADEAQTVCVTHAIPDTAEEAQTVCVTHAIPDIAEEAQTVCVTHAIPDTAEESDNVCVTHAIPDAADEAQTVCVTHAIPDTADEAQTVCVTHAMPDTAEESDNVCVTHAIPDMAEEAQTVCVTHAIPDTAEEAQTVCVTHAISDTADEAQTVCVTHAIPDMADEAQTVCVTHAIPDTAEESDNVCVTHAIPDTAEKAWSVCGTHAIPDTAEESDNVCVTHAIPETADEAQTACVTHAIPDTAEEAQTVCVTHAIPDTADEAQTVCVTHAIPDTADEAQTVCVTHAIPDITEEAQTVCVTHAIPDTADEAQTVCVTHAISDTAEEAQTVCVTHAIPDTADEAQTVCVTHAIPDTAEESDNVCVTHAIPDMAEESDNVCVTHAIPDMAEEAQTVCVTHAIPDTAEESDNVCGTHAIPDTAEEAQTVCVTHAIPDTAEESDNVCVTHAISDTADEAQTVCVTHAIPDMADEAQTVCVTHAIPDTAEESDNVCVTHAIPDTAEKAWSVCGTHAIPDTAEESDNVCVTHAIPETADEAQTACVTHAIPDTAEEAQTVCVTHAIPDTADEAQTVCVTHAIPDTADEAQTVCVTHAIPDITEEAQTVCVTHAIPDTADEAQTVCVTHAISDTAEEAQTVCVTHAIPDTADEAQTVCVTHAIPDTAEESDNVCVTHAIPDMAEESDNVCVTHAIPDMAEEAQTVCVTHAIPDTADSIYQTKEITSDIHAAEDTDPSYEIRRSTECLESPAALSIKCDAIVSCIHPEPTIIFTESVHQTTSSVSLLARGGNAGQEHACRSKTAIPTSRAVAQEPADGLREDEDILLGDADPEFLGHKVYFQSRPQSDSGHVHTPVQVCPFLLVDPNRTWTGDTDSNDSYSSGNAWKMRRSEKVQDKCVQTENDEGHGGQSHSSYEWETAIKEEDNLSIEDPDDNHWPRRAPGEGTSMSPELPPLGCPVKNVQHSGVLCKLEDIEGFQTSPIEVIIISDSEDEKPVVIPPADKNKESYREGVRVHSSPKSSLLKLKRKCPSTTTNNIRHEAGTSKRGLEDGKEVIWRERPESRPHAKSNSIIVIDSDDEIDIKEEIDMGNGFGDDPSHHLEEVAGPTGTSFVSPDIASKKRILDISGVPSPLLILLPAPVYTLENVPAGNVGGSLNIQERDLSRFTDADPQGKFLLPSAFSDDSEFEATESELEPVYPTRANTSSSYCPRAMEPTPQWEATNDDNLVTYAGSQVTDSNTSEMPSISAPLWSADSTPTWATCEGDVKRQMSECLSVLQKISWVLDGINGMDDPTIEEWRSGIWALQRQASQLPKTHIAVIGDTGAGKSSLLNALLDLEDVLPTSSMRACTAVVVEISKGSQNIYKAEVEFLSEEEWDCELMALLADMRDKSGKFKKRPDSKPEARVAYSRVMAVYGHIDELEVLKEDKTITKYLGTVKDISENSASALRSAIERYIDSSAEENRKKGGKFWPVVKCVRVFVPDSEVLQTGAVLVDLPGTRDSNAARDRIAKEYLKKSDVVWVVANITRAVDDKTAKDLLSAGLRRQLYMDGHRQSMAFICTKTDMYSVKEIKRALDLYDETCALEDKVQQLDHRLSAMKVEKQALYARWEERKDRSDMEDGEDPRNDFLETEQQIQFLEEKKEKLEKEIHLLCVRARNDYSKQRIRSEFQLSLRELEKGELDPEEEEEEDEEDTELEPSQQQPLRVFTVSSKAYLALTAKVPQESSTRVFCSESDTEIPDLRDFALETALRCSMSATERVIREMSSIISQIITYLTNRKAQDDSDQAQINLKVGGCMKEVEEGLSGAVRRANQEMKRLVNEDIAQSLAVGVRVAEQDCVKTVETWGSRNPGGYSYPTYKAACTRKGLFHSPTYGVVDFNEQLSEPMSRAIAKPWAEVFSEKLLDCLKDFSESVLQEIERFFQNMRSELQSLSTSTDTIQFIHRQQSKSAQAELVNFLADQKDYIISRQRNISRVLSPAVRTGMISAYLECESVRGEGSFEKMKATMIGHVRQHKATIFSAAAKKLMEQLDLLLTDIGGNLQSFAQERLRWLSQQCQSLLQPLKKEEEFLPDLRNIWTRVSRICRRTHVDFHIPELENILKEDPGHESLWNREEPPELTCTPRCVKLGNAVYNCKSIKISARGVTLRCEEALPVPFHFVRHCEFCSRLAFLALHLSPEAAVRFGGSRMPPADTDSTLLVLLEKPADLRPLHSLMAFIRRQRAAGWYRDVELQEGMRILETMQVYYTLKQEPQPEEDTDCPSMSRASFSLSSLQPGFTYLPTVRKREAESPGTGLEKRQRMFGCSSPNTVLEERTLPPEHPQSDFALSSSGIPQRSRRSRSPGQLNTDQLNLRK